MGLPGNYKSKVLAVRRLRSRRGSPTGLAGGGAVGSFELLKEHEFNLACFITAALGYGAIKRGVD